MLKYDMNKVLTGVRCVYPEPNSDGTLLTVTLAQMGGANREYQRRLEALTRPYRDQLQRGTMDNEKAEALFRKAFIQCCLKDWEGFQPDDDGTEQPYSEATADAVLSLPEWAYFYEWMQEQARNVENFRQTRLELEAKN